MSITNKLLLIGYTVFFAIIAILAVTNARLNTEIDVCRDTKTYDIRNINIEKTGKYYFQDSILKVEIIIFDTTFRGRVQVPVNMNEVIMYQEPYSDEVVEKPIKEIICR